MLIHLWANISPHERPERDIAGSQRPAVEYQKDGPDSACQFEQARPTPLSPEFGALAGVETNRSSRSILDMQGRGAFYDCCLRTTATPLSMGSTRHWEAAVQNNVCGTVLTT